MPHTRYALKQFLDTVGEKENGYLQCQRRIDKSKKDIRTVVGIFGKSIYGFEKSPTLSEERKRELAEGLRDAQRESEARTDQNIAELKTKQKIWEN